MADWRQIQARIRKAKTSSDPAAQLSDLYQRTSDAMVALELAQWHEKAGNASETIQWYTVAAQRFRRAQWRAKAEEALTRLGAPIPEPLPAAPPRRSAENSAAPAQDSSPAPTGMPYDPAVEGEVERDRSHGPDETQSSPVIEEDGSRTAASAGGPAAKPLGETALAQGKRRRRGRRGGRKRRGSGIAAKPAGSSTRGTEAAPAGTPMRASPRPPEPARESSWGAAEEPAPAERWSEIEASFTSQHSAAPAVKGSAPASWQAATSAGGAPSPALSRTRAGDPGLSSRIAQLESQLRRLLACPLASLDQAESAPAGPGVLLLSDSDQVTHYYIESCQTLRIGVGNLMRGGRGSKGGAQLKPELAEHLGISDSRVAKYMKDHCTVRWIQLDDGAAELAHFAMAVLKPVVSE